MDAAQKQIEYYLSEENLTKDNYLRSIMDNDGWIPLPIIMNFNRHDALQKRVLEDGLD